MILYKYSFKTTVTIAKKERKFDTIEEQKSQKKVFAHELMKKPHVPAISRQTETL